MIDSIAKNVRVFMRKDRASYRWFRSSAGSLTIIRNIRLIVLCFRAGGDSGNMLIGVLQWLILIADLLRSDGYLRCTRPGPGVVSISIGQTDR